MYQVCPLAHSINQLGIIKISDKNFYSHQTFIRVFIFLAFSW